LKRHKRVALDTSVFIYQAQAHPKYSVLTRRLFSWIEQPGSYAVSSTVTLTEVLVQPIRNKDENLESALVGLLTKFPNLDLIPVSVPIAALAARYRAEYGLRTPDAIQAATCIYSQVPALITNDASFRRIPEINVLILDDLF
jgi:predicted nucleic acid-binding protein